MKKNQENSASGHGRMGDLKGRGMSRTIMSSLAQHVAGVMSLGKTFHTTFLVLSETDVKFGGPVSYLRFVSLHVKNAHSSTVL